MKRLLTAAAIAAATITIRALAADVGVSVSSDFCWVVRRRPRMKEQAGLNSN